MYRFIIRMWVSHLIVFIFHFSILYRIVFSFYLNVGIPLYSGYNQCNLQNSNCMIRNRSKFSSVVPSKDAYGFSRVGNLSNIGMNCSECLPDCRETVREFDKFHNKTFKSTKISNFFFQKYQIQSITTHISRAHTFIDQNALDYISRSNL